MVESASTTAVAAAGVALLGAQPQQLARFAGVRHCVGLELFCLSLLPLWWIGVCATQSRVGSVAVNHLGCGDLRVGKMHC